MKEGENVGPLFVMVPKAQPLVSGYRVPFFHYPKADLNPQVVDPPKREISGFKSEVTKNGTGPVWVPGRASFFMLNQLRAEARLKLWRVDSEMAHSLEELRRVDAPGQVEILSCADTKKFDFPCWICF